MLKTKNVFLKKTPILQGTFLYQYMLQKIVFLSVLIGVVFLSSSCSFWGKNETEKEQKEITIFTLDILLGIHAKMIVGEYGKVIIAPEQKLSQDELSALEKSTIILGTTPISESKIRDKLGNYRGHYVTIESYSDNQVIYPSVNISEQIELVRNTLSELDPDHRWYYYDNTGSYIHLLEEMEKRLVARINEHHHAPFITLWGDFSNFIHTFGLEEYQMKHYPTIKNLMEDKNLKDFLRTKDVKNIFIYGSVQDWEIRSIENKYKVTVYHLAQLQEDTSGWGYLRYVEKIMNDFVRAFDTYD